MEIIYQAPTVPETYVTTRRSRVRNFKRFLQPGGDAQSHFRTLSKSSEIDIYEQFNHPSVIPEESLKVTFPHTSRILQDLLPAVENHTQQRISVPSFETGSDLGSKNLPYLVFAIFFITWDQSSTKKTVLNNLFLLLAIFLFKVHAKTSTSSARKITCKSIHL